ncbi:aromatic acid exporter family protein [Cytophagaceae bacterium DM2B3-1]|uniref:Aromatic acid exporter family protein n=1 Tax=Xanthocytophaga flava TaxID=3048013 RepID=A0ABT7CPW2_9BACT|nr:FUSC family protein [Xanthocytophaga flavus]MDJ1495746.1 aromatic acid exporter family protein [Xanthocytophaga flavus]
MKQIQALLEKLGLSLQAFKTALAAALSWIVAAQLLHAQYPYFAPLAAILTVQVTVADSWEKATQRIIGLIGGVLVSMLIGHWFPMGTISIFLVILLGMALAKVFRMNSQIISQVAVSSFIVLAFGGTQGYVLNRVVETFLGSAIAIAVNALIVPQKIIPTIQTHILTLSSVSAQALGGLTLLLESEENNQKARETIAVLVEKTEAAILAARTAEKALRYTPFLSRVKKRLTELDQNIRYLEHITVQIRGVRRAIFDLYTEMAWKPDSRATESLKSAISITAQCIELYGEAVVSGSEVVYSKLADSIEEAKQIQLQCLAEIHAITSLPVLRDMGSILTDLKRILKEVTLPER